MITDAIAAMGLKPGTYQLGQQRVTVDGVGAYLTESNILAGRYQLILQCCTICVVLMLVGLPLFILPNCRLVALSPTSKLLLLGAQ